MSYDPNEKAKNLNFFFKSKEEFESLLYSIPVRKISDPKVKKYFQKFKRWYKEYGWDKMEVYTGQIDGIKELSELKDI